MIFSLVEDFSVALKEMPREHSKRRTLELFQEAIRRDVHFIDRHPTTMFQCMWNTCWWYDCDEAAEHYIEPDGGWMVNNAPWLAPFDGKKDERKKGKFARFVILPPGSTEGQDN